MRAWPPGAGATVRWRASAREEGRIIDEAAANAAAAIRCREVVEERLQRRQGISSSIASADRSSFSIVRRCASATATRSRLSPSRDGGGNPAKASRRRASEIGSSVPVLRREAAARARGVTGILRATHREGVGKTVKTGPRGGSAQHADLERRGGPLDLARSRPSRSSGCARRASTRTGWKSSAAASAARRARRPASDVGQRHAGRILDRDVPAPEFRRDPGRERPVRRHESGPAPGPLQRLAQRDRDGERLLALVRRLDDRDAGEPRRRRGRRARRDPSPPRGRSSRPAAAPP